MLKKTIIFGFIISVLFTISFSTGYWLPQKKKNIIAINLDSYRIYLESNSSLDRLFIKDNLAFLLVNENEMQRIKQSGLKIMFQKDLPLSPPVSSLPQSSGDYNGRFHNYRETEEMLLELGNNYPDIAQVSSIGKSVEGRDLYIIKISDNVQQEESEPNVYFIGCHHAREWISVEIPLLFARHLLENYQNSTDIQQLVNGAQIYIMPLLNPDGLEFSIHTYIWWRKNRRYNSDLTWGVDLNRNYGYMWGYDNIGSSPNPGSDVYRGPLPFSEPETEAWRQFLLVHPPAGAITFHNYSQIILYPWGYIPEPTPDDAEMDAIAREMSERIFAVNGRVYEYGQGNSGIYPTNGDMDDWVYGTFGVPSYTVELPAPDYLSGAFFVPEEEINLSFADQLPAMIYFTKYFVQKHNDQETTEDRYKKKYLREKKIDQK